MTGDASEGLQLSGLSEFVSLSELTPVDEDDELLLLPLDALVLPLLESPLVMLPFDPPQLLLLLLDDDERLFFLERVFRSILLSFSVR